MYLFTIGGKFQRILLIKHFEINSFYFQGSCIVCNENNCTRHNSNFKVAEPWKNLLIHKQLDESIENVIFTNSLV